MRKHTKRSIKSAAALMTCVVVMLFTTSLPLAGGGIGIARAQAQETVHVHEYTEIVYRQPDCSKTGIKKLLCLCGDVQWVITPAAHTPGRIDTTLEPSCTQPGEGVLYCEVCGKVMDQQHVIPALGHVPGDTIITVEPDCTQAGKHITNCLVCGEVCCEEDFGEALGHKPGKQEIVEPDCQGKGGSSPIALSALSPTGRMSMARHWRTSWVSGLLSLSQPAQSPAQPASFVNCAETIKTLKKSPVLDMTTAGSGLLRKRRLVRKPAKALNTAPNAVKKLPRRKLLSLTPVYRSLRPV